MTTLTASPAKLANGTWGARVAGVAKPGDAITITTAAGKSWTASVVKVVWTGGNVTIVATASTTAASAPLGKSFTRTGSRTGTGSRTIRRSSCADCRRIGKLCPQCRFDEYDY